MQTRVKLEGFKQTADALERLPAVVGKRVVGFGMAKGAQVVKAQGKKTAPVRKSGGLKYMGPKDRRVRAPGFLKRKGVTYQRRRGSFVWFVGASRSAHYGAKIEAGTRHIKRRQPWLRTAYRMTQGRIVPAVVKGMASKLDKEVSKLYRGRR